MCMDKPSRAQKGEFILILIEGFKIKLENGLMELPRFSDDPDFIEMTTAIKYISDEVSLNVV